MAPRPYLNRHRTGCSALVAAANIWKRRCPVSPSGRSVAACEGQRGTAASLWYAGQDQTPVTGSSMRQILTHLTSSRVPRSGGRRSGRRQARFAYRIAGRRLPVLQPLRARINQPTPREARTARKAAFLSQTEAALLVTSAQSVPYRSWQGHEVERGKPEERAIPLATSEFFLLMTDQHPAYQLAPQK